MRVIFAQLLLAAATLRVATKSPVEKVVELITELQAKITADGEEGQKIYDKFACWCEKTTKRKANSIDEGKSTIGKTTTRILTLKGGIAVLASEIAKAEADIAKNQASIKQLTNVRQKENSDFQQNKAYMETAVGSLHMAIEVLNGAGTGGAMGLLKVAAQVRSAVLSSPHVDALPESKSKLLKEFLESPTAFSFAQAAAPQSATVTGILKDMYETFAADLEKSNADESTAQEGFETILKDKEDKIKLLEEIVTNKAAEKAEKTQQLAENEQLLGATSEQLSQDEEFFATSSDSCKAKTDAWQERSRLRTEEQAGITKALEILTSDDAKSTFTAATETRPQDTFGSAGVSFVQLEANPAKKAYKILKKAIGHTKNMKLASIAAALRTATTGHFDDVIGSIDTMVTTLAGEGQEDIKQRDWCIEERNNEANTQNDQEYKISQLEAKIGRAQVKKEKLEADVTKTEGDKSDLEDEMELALSDREAENGAFHTAKDDDTKAIGLLEDAITAMSSYGKNNALLQQPEFEVSKDQAPDAQFEAADKHKGASDGIVALLTTIKENLENEVGLGQSSEAKAVEQYDALKKTSDALIVAYDKQLTGLAASIASTDLEMETDGTSKTDEEGERDATIAYLEQIGPNCEWIEGAFTQRAENRKKETEGLGQAKSVLAGSEGSDYGFLQRN